jgi:hypothetical protein
MTYRTGDMIAPRIEAIEPLSEEVQDYADAIIHGREPRSNAALGLQIVLALNAAEESLRRHGEPVRVPALSPAGSVGGSGGMAGGWDLRSPI